MKTITIKSVIHAKSFHEKIIGLLYKNDPHSMHFTTRFGIHTFGMRFPIDVIICDSYLVVRKLKINLRPNQIFLWNPLFSHVLELPSGEIQRNKLRVGDTLVLQ